MIIRQVKEKQIYKDFALDQAKEWFDLKDKKVLHNIDTLYVTATVNEDYFANQNFISYLKSLKELVVLEPFYISEHDCYMTDLNFKNYRYCIEKKDCFLLCFMGCRSIDTVPPIIIQIRSQFLWLYGEYECMKKIDIFLKQFLGDFHLTISAYKENRIDYAYHTNYIRSMTTFFNNLNQMQVSHFRRGSKEFAFTGDGDEDVDYISIGRRKSNNIFIRIYNKTKEVIEQGYKQFFIQYWYENGLINAYDKYLYESCFVRRSYEYMAKARLNFYLEYGSDLNALDKVKALLSRTAAEYDDIVALADELTPRPTLITNIEFQTKRKFYATFSSECMALLQCVTPCEPQLKYLFTLLDNKQLIHNVLTYDVFRLVDVSDNKSRKREKKTLPFWELVQKCKINGRIENGKLYREYQRRLDIESLKSRISNQISMLGLYLDPDSNSNIYDDTMDFLSCVNESDFEKALTYKKKKVPTVKAKCETLNKVDIVRVYGLINKADGTYID